jgi:hypothetical protein
MSCISKYKGIGLRFNPFFYLNLKITEANTPKILNFGQSKK